MTQPSDTAITPDPAQTEQPASDPIGAAEEAMLTAVAEETEEQSEKGRNVDALFNVKLDVRVVLGHKKMPVAELLKLTRGSVVELDRKVGEPVDIMINDRLVARGDLVKIEGDMIGVALREIIKDFAPGE